MFVLVVVVKTIHISHLVEAVRVVHEMSNVMVGGVVGVIHVECQLWLELNPGFNPKNLIIKKDT
jgi:hypothetical protein